MKHELKLRKIRFKTELVVPVNFKVMAVSVGLRCDLFIDDILPVELKSVDPIHPIHEAQIVTYMKLLGSPKGLLINYNCTHIFSEGQRTFVNDMYRELH